MDMEDFTYQPIEIHMLYFIEKHELNTVSLSFLDDFCDNFVKNMNILRMFSESYRNDYKRCCIELLTHYVNKPKRVIIEDILERSNKWDVYGITILYIHIFGTISRVLSLKDTFINRITVMLTRNIHPDSNKRMTLEETLNKWNHLLFEENYDWKYINKLDATLLIRLFDELSK
jgi:hypothetical protein